MLKVQLRKCFPQKQQSRFSIEWALVSSPPCPLGPLVLSQLCDIAAPRVGEHWQTPVKHPHPVFPSVLCPVRDVQLLLLCDWGDGEGLTQDPRGPEAWSLVLCPDPSCCRGTSGPNGLRSVSLLVLGGIRGCLCYG